MKAGRIDGVFLDISKLLLAFEDSDLVFLENLPPLILVTVLRSVDPLDDDRLGCRSDDRRIVARAQSA